MPVTCFPSAFRNSVDVSRALYHAALWSGGRKAGVKMHGFDVLKIHVMEISRSPSQGRVAKLARLLGTLPAAGDSGALLRSDIAADIFRASLEESHALLELGYPRRDAPVFTTALPMPARNTRRTRNQIRSAVHHLGGNMQLLMTLFGAGGVSDPAVKVAFHSWPPERIPDNVVVLRLPYPGQEIPAVMLLDRSIFGYVMLACWDIALRMKDSEDIPAAATSFTVWAGKEKELK